MVYDFVSLLTSLLENNGGFATMPVLENKSIIDDYSFDRDDREKIILTEKKWHFLIMMMSVSRFEGVSS